MTVTIAHEVRTLCDILVNDKLELTPVVADVLTNIKGRDLFILYAVESIDKGDTTLAKAITDLAFSNLELRTWSKADHAVAEVAYACIFLAGAYDTMRDLGGQVWERMKLQDKSDESFYRYSLLRMLNDFQWKVANGEMTYDEQAKVFASSVRDVAVRVRDEAQGIV